jgi:hypothetical protein
MSNASRTQKAIAAIDEVFYNCSIREREVLDELKTLRTHLNDLIEAISVEGERSQFRTKKYNDATRKSA